MDAEQKKALALWRGKTAWTEHACYGGDINDPNSRVSKIAAALREAKAQESESAMRWCEEHRMELMRGLMPLSAMDNALANFLSGAVMYFRDRAISLRSKQDAPATEKRDDCPLCQPCPTGRCSPSAPCTCEPAAQPSADNEPCDKDAAGWCATHTRDSSQCPPSADASCIRDGVHHPPPLCEGHGPCQYKWPSAEEKPCAGWPGCDLPGGHSGAHRRPAP